MADMIIYETSSVRVEDATADRGGDTVVVTFPARTNNQRLHRKGFGQDFLSKKGIPAIHVKADRNHWFQIDPMAEVAKAISGVSGRYGRVICYGSSMGAYAAIMFGAHLRADGIIAISPQFSIDRAKVPFEKRWAEEASLVSFEQDEMAALAQHVRDLILIYDPLGPDGRHGGLIGAAIPSARHLRLPFAGHPAGAFLRDTGQISGLVYAVITGECDLVAARRLARSRREKSAIYWMNMSTRLSRRMPDLALAAAKKAVEIAPDNAATQAQLGKIQLRAGDVRAAKTAFNAAVHLKPAIAKYQLMLQETEGRVGG